MKNFPSPGMSTELKLSFPIWMYGREKFIRRWEWVVARKTCRSTFWQKDICEGSLCWIFVQQRWVSSGAVSSGCVLFALCPSSSVSGVQLCACILLNGGAEAGNKKEEVQQRPVCDSSQSLLLPLYVMSWFSLLFMQRNCHSVGGSLALRGVYSEGSIHPNFIVSCWALLSVRLAILSCIIVNTIGRANSVGCLSAPVSNLM